MGSNNGIQRQLTILTLVGAYDRTIQPIVDNKFILIEELLHQLFEEGVVPQLLRNHAFFGSH